MERKKILEILTGHCAGVASTKENGLVATKVYLDDLADELLNLFDTYNVSKSLPTKDVEFIYSLLPDWVKNKTSEGLDPTMYGTLSKEGDDEIQERVKQILGNVY